jgi:hypothetical protein
MRLGSAPSRGIGTLLVISSLSIGCEVNTGWILSPEGCSNKTAVDAELHVDTSDDRYIWAIDRQTGAAISLRIPGGYGVSTEPDAVVDPIGAVIGRTGDVIVSGCMDIVQNALMIDETDITSG